MSFFTVCHFPCGSMCPNTHKLCTAPAIITFVQYVNELTNHAVEWMDWRLVPYHPAGKLKRRMCHGIQLNPNYVCHRPFYDLHCRAKIHLYYPAPNSTTDHIPSKYRQLLCRQQIWHESAFPSIYWGPKLILFVVALFVRHLVGYLDVAVGICRYKRNSIILEILGVSGEMMLCTYLSITHFTVLFVAYGGKMGFWGKQARMCRLRMCITGNRTIVYRGYE